MNIEKQIFILTGHAFAFSNVANPKDVRNSAAIDYHLAFDDIVQEISHRKSLLLAKKVEKDLSVIFLRAAENNAEFSELRSKALSTISCVLRSMQQTEWEDTCLWPKPISRLLPQPLRVIRAKYLGPFRQAYKERFLNAKNLPSVFDYDDYYKRLINIAQASDNHSEIRKAAIQCFNCLKELADICGVEMDEKDRFSYRESMMYIARNADDHQVSGPASEVFE